MARSRLFQSVRVIGLTLAGLIMLASFFVYMAPHFGWRVDGLRSGSMAPQLNTGDLVITRPASAESVQVNDVIVFRPVDKRANLISHRVISIETVPSLSFQTKGDANDSPDPFIVPAANLVGKTFFHLPLLGYAVLFVQTASGLIVFLVLPGILLMGWSLKTLGYELAGRARKAV